MKTVTVTTGCVITGEGVGRSVIGTVGVGVGSGVAVGRGVGVSCSARVSCGVTSAGFRVGTGTERTGTSTSPERGRMVGVGVTPGSPAFPPGVCASGNVTEETDENRAVGFGAVMVPAATEVAAIRYKGKKEKRYEILHGVHRFGSHG